MHKILQHLLLFEKFTITTELSKREIHRKIYSLTDPEYTEYHGRITDTGFWIAKNHHTYSSAHGAYIWAKTPFVPLIKATITQKDGKNIVSCTLSMDAYILFIPIYLASLVFLWTFPIMLGILHLTFFRSAKALKESLEYALI